MIFSENIEVAEAVSEGHPDKICDQIADKILDECLKQDSESHVACEVFITEEFILIGGEITSKANLDYEKIARKVLYDIGYIEKNIGIGYKSCKINVLIKKQSNELKNIVNKICANDQSIVVGFAVNDNENYIPNAIFLANEIVKKASLLRKENKFKYARPDMKSQIIMNNGKIKNILISIQHEKKIDSSFKNFVYEKILLETVKKYNFNTDFDFSINPSSFILGGPLVDTGLTGRKLMCDSYGCSCSHGGGSFSGKDPTKVDRSGAYYARYIAKNLVAAGIAEKIEIKLIYEIGLSKPKEIIFNTFKPNYKDDTIKNIIEIFFDASIENIINSFSLKKPSFNYFDLSIYGHFGRTDLNLPWEKLDKVEEIKKYLMNK